MQRNSMCAQDGSKFWSFCHVLYFLRMAQRRRAVRSAKTQPQVFSSAIRRQRTASEKLADVFTNSFGTVGFLGLNAMLFLFWFLANGDMIPGVPVFDPYPFGMLTTMVSLEAIFLSIIVLMSQSRAAKIADLREEIDLQVNIEVEQEVTQILRMLSGIEKKLSVKEHNSAELDRMERDLDLGALKKKVVKELER